MIWPIEYTALSHKFLNDQQLTFAMAFTPASPESVDRYVEVSVNVRFDRWGTRRSPRRPQQRTLRVMYHAESPELLAEAINTLKFDDVGKTGTITYTDAAGRLYTSTAALMRVDDSPPRQRPTVTFCEVRLVIDEETPIVRVVGAGG